MLLLKVKDLLVSYFYCYHPRVMFSIDIIKFEWLFVKILLTNICLTSSVKNAYKVEYKWQIYSNNYIAEDNI